MAITSSTGLFSGLETGKIISQLMAVERRPIELLSKKKSVFEAKISSYGSISSALSSLKNALSALKRNSFLSVSAFSSDSTVFTASATSSASEGTYSIKVNNIATSQSIYSQAFMNEADAVADLSVFNAQKLRVQVGSSDAVDITIDSTNNTLTGIRDAINNANAGVRASVINDGAGYRLVLNSSSTGDSNRIKIMVDEDNNGIFEEAPSETDGSGLSRIAFNAVYDSNGNVTGGITNMTQSQTAVNASLLINGLTVSRSSNSINDLISGVTINLMKDSSGNTLNLSVSKDTSKIMNNINSFVSAYNSVMNAAKKASDKSAALDADSAVRAITGGLRSVISTEYADKSLLRFGLNHDKFGVLSLNSSTFENSIKNNLQDVINTFDAMANDLENKINNYINNLIPGRTTGVKNSIKFIESRIENMERMLDNKETAYRKRFMALEKTLGALQQSGDFLTRQFDLISKTNSKA
jgi:flagellar hook-associated protein 2